MFWRLNELPELKCLEPRERSAVLQRISWRQRLRLGLPAMVAAGFVSLFLTLLATEMYRGPWLPAVFAVAWVAAALVFYQLILQRVRHAVRCELAAAFVIQAPICFACGYDLRGHAGPRCPECGHRDHPSTRPASAMRTLGRFVGRRLRKPTRRRRKSITSPRASPR